MYLFACSAGTIDSALCDLTFLTARITYNAYNITTLNRGTVANRKRSAFTSNLEQNEVVLVVKCRHTFNREDRARGNKFRRKLTFVLRSHEIFVITLSGTTKESSASVADVPEESTTFQKDY